MVSRVIDDMIVQIINIDDEIVDLIGIIIKDNVDYILISLKYSGICINITEYEDIESNIGFKQYYNYNQMMFSNVDY